MSEYQQRIYLTFSRWTGVKEITALVTLPGPSRQACVGVIDGEKGTIVDVINR